MPTFLSKIITPTRSLYAVAALASALISGPAVAQPGPPIGAPRGAFAGDAGAVMWLDGLQYCWYDSAWRGPGWYRCGYQWRSGFGWGGPFGWRGWYIGHGPRGHWHRPPPHHPPHHGGPKPGGPKPGSPKPGGPGHGGPRPGGPG